MTSKSVHVFLRALFGCLTFYGNKTSNNYAAGSVCPMSTG